MAVTQSAYQPWAARRLLFRGTASPAQRLTGPAQGIVIG
jgi:hypothetical protein